MDIRSFLPVYGGLMDEDLAEDFRFGLMDNKKLQTFKVFITARLGSVFSPHSLRKFTK